MEKIGKQMRATIALLVALNLGMAGLYFLTVPVYVAATDPSRVTRGPLMDRWLDADGIEHHVTTDAVPGETFDQHVQRHKARASAVRDVFPPRS